MTPHQLATEVQNAFDSRDRDQHTRFLARLAASTNPAQANLAALTREQLQERRNALHVQLAAVNDQLKRMDAAGQQRQQADRNEWLRQQEQQGSLDPSDPVSYAGPIG